MKLVKHLLDGKGRDIVSVVPDSTVLEAIILMADKAIGSLMVMVDDELLGIVTERDYARKVIIKGRSSKTTRVSEIMTTGVFTTSSTKSVNDCMSVMTEKHIRHLPVLEGNRVIGMISIGDLVQAIISDQKEEIEQLENYISGM
ncbi:MAG: CBS domain-containing protein [Woeseiaceae bacterium]|nr:CBS domain-containing protein [Woeseiaceae bacterium]MDX2607702.1 CBS domain-containing protein [Woeseiaceae bacterium]